MQTTNSSKLLSNRPPDRFRIFSVSKNREKMKTAKKRVWRSELVLILYALILCGTSSMYGQAQSHQTTECALTAWPKPSVVLDAGLWTGNRGNAFEADGVLVSTACIPPAQSDGQEAQETRRGVPVLRNADENAWLANLEYYSPQPGFDRLNRDIELENFRIARAWHFPQGWEFQVGGLLFRASGTRTTNVSPPGIERSDALGFGLSPAARWNFLQFSRVRLYGDLAPGINFTNNPFPAGGTNYSFFLRAGAGASFRLNKAFWIEAAYWWTHVSNGQGLVPGNPAWQGEGVSLGLRRATRLNARQRADRRGWPLLREADEKAWLTEAEYFAPLSVSNPVNAGLNIRAYRVARAWHFSNGLEFQFGGSTFPSPLASGFGPLLRWNFFERSRWRLFLDGDSDFLKTGFFFLPLSGDHYNFFFRAGSGASYELHLSYWLEAVYRWGHTLEGWNGPSAYSSWSGQGISLGIRHTFH